MGIIRKQTYIITCI